MQNPKSQQFSFGASGVVFDHHGRANVAVQRLRINLASLQPELTNPLQQRC
ncbi:MAG TPA: hypothetical protein IGS37_18895 [Synechococcales cyanobacterium M55_K2018_004]|nr:hypothetical protein [Synechococcales cyanobacterium M55_K2018_004]